MPNATNASTAVEATVVFGLWIAEHLRAGHKHMQILVRGLAAVEAKLQKELSRRSVEGKSDQAVAWPGAGDEPCVVVASDEDIDDQRTMGHAGHTLLPAMHALIDDISALLGVEVVPALGLGWDFASVVGCLHTETPRSSCLYASQAMENTSAPSQAIAVYEK